VASFSLRGALACAGSNEAAEQAFATTVLSGIATFEELGACCDEGVLRFGWLIIAALSAWGASQLQAPFASEVKTPEKSLILPLLKAACGEGVRTVTAKGKDALGCGDASMDDILAARKRGRRYRWMPYVLWEDRSRCKVVRHFGTLDCSFSDNHR
jgi:hypothetical protein